VPSKRSLNAKSETTRVPMKKSPCEKKYREEITLPNAPITVKPFAVIPIASMPLQIGVMKAVTGALNRLAIIEHIVGFSRERTQ
jgi:hypothetical protein